jgi:hypothetical protein
MSRDGKRDKQEFTWRGLALYLERRKLLTLVADATYPHLYRIQYPDGWTSTPANLTRAKDAAYGHARYLLTRLSPAEGSHSPETTTGAALPPTDKKAA